MVRNSQKVVLITGATGGIGQEVATRLARMDYTVVITGRDHERGEAALAGIRQQSGNPNVVLMRADLSSQNHIRKLADDVQSRFDRLDVLINNVGGLYGKRWESVDGIEGTLALNHLCPFLLTHLLLPLLERSAPSRIVNINSEGHRAAGTVDVEAFSAARWKRGFPLYSQSKLAGLLFTYELARRLEGTGVTVNAVHPGIVDTPLFRRFLAERFFFVGGFVAQLAAFIARQVSYRIQHFDTIEAAAECPVYLASSDEVAGITGKYFYSDKRMRESSPPSHDKALSRRIWNLSSELTGLADRELSAAQGGRG